MATYLRIGTDKTQVSTLEIGDVEISYSLKDIKNYGKSNSSYSKPITVLRTKESDSIFKGLNSINIVNGFDIGTKIDAEIVKNGITILSGSLQVVEITPEYYNVIVYTNNLSLFDLVGEKYIKGNLNIDDDLIFTDNLYSQYYDPSTVRLSLQSSPSDNGYGIIYPVIDYNGALNNALILEKNYPILPAIGAKQIFDKLLSDNGYTYYISNDISTMLNKMYIPLNNDNLKHNYQYAKWYASKPVINWMNYLGQIAAFNPETPNNIIINWALDKIWGDSSVGYDYLQQSSRDASCFGLDLPIGIINIDASLQFQNPGTSHDEELKCSLWTVSSDQTRTEYELGTVTYADLSTNGYAYLNASKTIVNNTISKLWLTATPKTPTVTHYKDTEWTFDYKGLTTPFSVYIPALCMHTNSYIKLTLKDTLYFNTITVNDILPIKYKQKDFISDIFKMTNAYVIEKNNTLYINSYNDFYNNTKKDWSNKITSDFNISLLKNEQPSAYILDYNKGDDSYNKDFLDKNDYAYGARKIKNDSNFSSGETKISLSIPSTILKKINTDYIVPTVVSPSITLDPTVALTYYTYLVQTFLDLWNYYDQNLWTGSEFIDVEGNNILTVTSNTTWIAIPNVSWLSITPAIGSGISTHTITAADYRARTASRTVTPPAWNAKKTGLINFYAYNDRSTVLATKTVYSVNEATQDDWR